MGHGRRTALYLNTIRGLRLRQVADRVVRSLTRPLRVPSQLVARAPGCRRPSRDPGISFLPRAVSFVPPGEFSFLNDVRRVDPKDHGRPKTPLLWDYNFHYFDGLLAPSPSEQAKQSWISDWIRNVPVGRSPAWDPYPTSRRIANWVKWASGSGTPIPEGFNRSLATQARMLERSLEYHLMANHLLANAVALALAGVYFEEQDGERWLEAGMTLLESEVEEQILADGGHFELSPAYHSLIFEDLLDLMQLLGSRGLVVPSWMTDALKRAATWLNVMLRPDGRLPLFNDASDDMARSPSQLLDHAARLGVTARGRSERGITQLGSSGYFRYEFERLLLFGDVGRIGPDYQPGHGHCDMLSFELCWNGRPVVVDTGTSTYEMGNRRDIERGTAAHNTVQVGSLEQSEVWGGFRVARRATPLRVEVSDTRVEALIRAFPEGWSELQRDWVFDGEAVEILDFAVKGVALSSPLCARLHFHPDTPPRRREVGWTAGGLTFSFEGANSVREVDYEYAPEFNRKIPASCLEIGFTRALTTRIGSSTS